MQGGLFQPQISLKSCDFALYQKLMCVCTIHHKMGPLGHYH